MQWRVYSRIGRVFGAELPGPSVIRTDHGLIEADAGDFLIADDGATTLRHIPAGYFPRVFSEVQRPIPLRTLADLSALVARNVRELAAGDAGELCAACGENRTERRVDGKPTCPACELADRAEREDRMECRNDGALMVKEVIENLIVDRCPECGGVWLDGGELEFLGDAIHRAAVPGGAPDVASRLVHSLVRGRAE